MWAKGIMPLAYAIQALNLPKFEEILTSPMAAPLGSLQS
jgi:hypothetical protein